MRRIFAASLAISAALAAAFTYFRAGIDSPFSVRIFQHFALFHDYHAFLPYIAILVLGLLPSMRQAGAQFAAWCGHNVLWVALAAVVVLAAGTHAVYHLHPLSLDEQLALSQSRIFAEGRLAGQFPLPLMDWLVPPDFRGKFIVVAGDGAHASAYWPGFSLLLLPFTALGVPWLLNPLIGGATLLVLRRIALRLFGTEESAGLVVLFALGSQAVTFNALSFYAMPAHLLASAIYALLLLSPAPGRALAAGLVGSFALVLHNPVPHLLFCLPWMVWLAWSGKWKSLAALVAGYLPVGVGVGWGWALFLANLESGQPFSVDNALQVLAGRLGSAASWAHGSMLEMRTLDFGKLWLWASPALVAAAAVGAAQTWREPGPWKALICAGVLTYAGYFLLPFAQGHGWGYRYFHSAWLVLPLLAAATARGAARPLAGYLAACALLSLVILSSLRALQVEQFIDRHLAQRPVARRGEARVVLVNLRGGYYIWDLVQNDPFLRSRPVMLHSKGAAADQALLASQFPDLQPLSADPRGSVWGVP